MRRKNAISCLKCLVSALGELGKSFWSAEKKLIKFFENPPIPPQENPRSAPARFVI